MLLDVLVLCEFIINIIIFFFFVVVVVVAVVFFFFLLLLLLIRGCVPVVILVIGFRFRLVESRSVDGFLPREMRKPEEEEVRKNDGAMMAVTF